MPLKIAISHPIYNNRFNIMSRWTGTIDGNLTASSSTTFTDSVPTGRGEGPREMGISQGSEAAVPELDFAGDLAYVVLGPSTNASYLGLTEHKILQTAAYGTSVNTYTMQSAVANSYQAGDPYSIISYGLPDGWVATTPAQSTNSFCFGRVLTTNLFPQKTGGLTDVYSWQILNIPSSNNNGAHIRIGKLLPGEKYVLSTVYRGIGLSGGTCNIHIEEKATTTYASLGYIGMGNSANWSSATLTVTAGASQADDAVIWLNTPSGVTGTGVLIRSLSLSQQVFDYGYVGSDGIPTLPNLYPDGESITVTRRTVTEKSASNFASKVRPVTPHQAMGVALPVTRYTIGMHFSHAPISDLILLEKLIQYQNMGYLVNYFPGLTGVPHCLTGVIDVQITERFSMHNHSIVSFNFKFTEVEV